jgi:hypothetical protein
MSTVGVTRGCRNDPNHVSGLTRPYPAGIRVIAEHWPMAADIQVVTIFSADDIAAVWELVAEWEDVFDIDVSPAISAEDGLRVGPEVFGRLSRLRA